jgi:hypothetical protein
MPNSTVNTIVNTKSIHSNTYQCMRMCVCERERECVCRCVFTCVLVCPSRSFCSSICVSVCKHVSSCLLPRHVSCLLPACAMHPSSCFLMSHHDEPCLISCLTPACLVMCHASLVMFPQSLHFYMLSCVSSPPHPTSHLFLNTAGVPSQETNNPPSDSFVVRV